MKKTDVQIGAIYTAKVSGQIVRVRVFATSNFGGWRALNESTGREIHIRSARRLRSKA